MIKDAGQGVALAAEKIVAKGGRVAEVIKRVRGLWSNGVQQGTAQKISSWLAGSSSTGNIGVALSDIRLIPDVVKDMRGGVVSTFTNLLQGSGRLAQAGQAVLVWARTNIIDRFSNQRNLTPAPTAQTAEQALQVNDESVQKNDLVEINAGHESLVETSLNQTLDSALAQLGITPTSNPDEPGVYEAIRSPLQEAVAKLQAEDANLVLTDEL